MKSFSLCFLQGLGMQVKWDKQRDLFFKRGDPDFFEILYFKWRLVGTNY